MLQTKPQFNAICFSIFLLFLLFFIDVNKLSNNARTKFTKIHKTIVFFSLLFYFYLMQIFLFETNTTKTNNSNVLFKCLWTTISFHWYGLIVFKRKPTYWVRNWCNKFTSTLRKSMENETLDLHCIALMNSNEWFNQRVNEIFLFLVSEFICTIWAWCYCYFIAIFSIVSHDS